MAKIYDSTGKAMLDVTTVDEQSWKKRLQDKLDEFSQVPHENAIVDLHFRTFGIVEKGNVKRIDATDDFIADITADGGSNVFAEFKATPAPTLANMVPQELMQQWIGAGYTIESNVRFFRKKNKQFFDVSWHQKHPQWSRYNKYDENGDRHMCFSVPGTGNVECPVGEVIPDGDTIDVIKNDDFVPGLFGHQLNSATGDEQIWLPLLRGVARVSEDCINGITIKPRGNLFRKGDSWSSYGTHITLLFHYRYIESGKEVSKGLENACAKGCIHIPCAFAQEFVVKDTEGNVVFEMASRKVKGAIKVSVKGVGKAETVVVDIENRTIDVELLVVFDQEP